MDGDTFPDTLRMYGFVVPSFSHETSVRGRRRRASRSCQDMSEARHMATSLLKSAGLVDDHVRATDMTIIAPDGEAQFMSNGFLQIVTEGRRCVCLLPGQRLREHYHDVDELFHITGGSVDVATPDDTNTLSVGDDINIPRETIHSLYASEKDGCQFFSDEGQKNRITVWTDR
uniref:Cupin 2 conserved barrel domain-containing protein n=1 Tax=Rhodosorus marinus TaxID=101924 RepID=A0A7S0BN86_9RHOD|mmetsp:Transcript_24699/g.35580  ORF Transcript_24699/g.35580 Transcript_24699/m.35580 type:complete len:173 (+) Transcript_24699:153-671(+)|eukprot:CAMPEP_0184749640 /NCGR_PEP_ID=MMETSP0315-20130426/29625_1 /TAXON_ID=101924 /ORGANISM="Rhodosorus marinus, Strain UTEX LB 2760" /LENGTH=172 /DNA_ID=CAMNT_0027226875 /DNA_START=144 /DNA_END=662 /DNA_ORIENTATION=-